MDLTKVFFIIVFLHFCYCFSVDFCWIFGPAERSYEFKNQKTKTQLLAMYE